jgi:hypothetical protein
MSSVLYALAGALVPAFVAAILVELIKARGLQRQTHRSATPIALGRTFALRGAAHSATSQPIAGERQHPDVTYTCTADTKAMRGQTDHRQGDAPGLRHRRKQVALEATRMPNHHRPPGVSRRNARHGGKRRPATTLADNDGDPTHRSPPANPRSSAMPSSTHP